MSADVFPLHAVKSDRGTSVRDDINETQSILRILYMVKRVLEALHAGVQVVCSESTTHVITDIINGGAPVPENLLDTFFDKFNSTKAGRGGTGLGTTYARIVTEAHGGVISVRSSIEEGTRVRVELPRVTS